jgi:ABC-2 type transport system permease protein
MTTPPIAAPANAAGPLGAGPTAPAARGMPAFRTLYWTVRRELWENRSLYIAPLAIAAVLLCAAVVGTIHLPERRRAVLELSPALQRAAVEQPYDMAVMMVILISFLVAAFYCLDALYGERRDRSILFWKSLPVSDITVVLAKAAVPLVVMPLIGFAIIEGTYAVMLLLGSAVLLMSGLTPATLGPQLRYIPSPVAVLYAVTVFALWYAPIYGWLLLVSAWAKRMAVLWATLPILTLAVFERMAFRSTHLSSFLRYRLSGWMTEAFAAHAHDRVPLSPLSSLDPGRFLSTSSLWIGLGVAALFITAAVEIRRYREPI